MKKKYGLTVHWYTDGKREKIRTEENSVLNKAFTFTAL
jgi:hypothetical protein